jgi:hypothetical protein
MIDIPPNMIANKRSCCHPPRSPELVGWRPQPGNGFELIQEVTSRSRSMKSLVSGGCALRVCISTGSEPSGGLAEYADTDPADPIKAMAMTPRRTVCFSALITSLSCHFLSVHGQRSKVKKMILFRTWISHRRKKRLNVSLARGHQALCRIRRDRSC